MWDVAGALIGPALGYVGQRQANDANRDIAHNATVSNMEEASRNRAFQADQAHQQMNFQERMSSTAYQRSTQDLRSAGLNPILAALGSGASTPSGASGSGAQGSAATATMENAMGSLVSAGKDVMAIKQAKQALARGEKEIGLLDAQTKKTNIDAKVAEKGVPQSDMVNKFYKILEPYVDRVVERSQPAAAKKREQQHEQNRLDSDRRRKQLQGLP